MILVIDTETTGVDPEKDAVCEIAAVPVQTRFPQALIDEGLSSLVAIGRRIPPQAKAVHHIQEEELRTALQLPQAIEYVHNGAKAQDIFAYAAHNAPFDSGFVKPPLMFDRPWICTWRCAMHLLPDMPSYSNQALRYAIPSLDTLVRALFIDYRREDMAPHRALYDAIVTAVLLRHLLEKRAPGDLVELSRTPVLLTKVAFGKHRGELWRNVPKDYLRWVLRTGDFDQDVLHTAKHYA